MQRGRGGAGPEGAGRSKLGGVERDSAGVLQSQTLSWATSPLQPCCPPPNPRTLSRPPSFPLKNLLISLDPATFSRAPKGLSRSLPQDRAGPGESFSGTCLAGLGRIQLCSFQMPFFLVLLP